MSTISDPLASTPGSLVDDALEVWEAAVAAFLDQMRPAAEDLTQAAAAGVEAAREAIAQSARRRPVASMIAALGAGVFVGCLIAGRRR